MEALERRRQPLEESRGHSPRCSGDHRFNQTNLTEEEAHGKRSQHKVTGFSAWFLLPASLLR